MAISNLTGQKTYQSFQNLMQISSSGEVYDGLGNLVTFLQLTSSFTSGSTGSGGKGAGFPFSGSAVITGSLTVTGSIQATQGFTGSLFGTSSWTTNSLTSSFVTGSNVVGPFGSNSILSASFAVSSSAAKSSSFAISASWAENSPPPTLNEVTTEGNETSNPIKIIDTGNNSTQLQANGIVFEDLDDLGITGLSFQQNSEPIPQIVEVRPLGGIMALLSDIPATGSFVITSSFNEFTSSYNTGSFTGSFNGSYTGSLFGTASFASTASFLNSTTNAFIQNGNSFGATALLGTNDNQSLALETSGSTRMFISSSGFVGIGTITPTGSLHIVGATSSSLSSSLLVQNVNRSASLQVFDDQTIQINNTLTTNQTYLQLGQGGSVAIRLNSTGQRFVGPSYFENYIQGYVIDTRIKTYDNTKNIVFFNSSNVELARITNSGSIGIGTTTPSASLHISGASSANLLRIDSTASSSILFVSGSGNVGIGTATPTSKFEVTELIPNSMPATFRYNSDYYLGIGYNRILSTLTGGASFKVGTSALSDLFFVTNNTDRLLIKSSGNILINTTTDAGYRLDVNGTARITDGLTVTGSLTVTQGITGSLFGTSSWAQTASIAPNYLPLTGGTIAGSLTINNNLTVLGSASIQYISESVLNIGANLITVNTATPAVRFGGLAIIDSGSSPQVSASFLYDSQQDEFVFVHKGTSAGATTSSVFLLGPETYNNLGNETYLTANRIPKGTGIEHLNDSNISDNGSVVSVNSNSEITGSLKVTSDFFAPIFYDANDTSYYVNPSSISKLFDLTVTSTNGIKAPIYYDSDDTAYYVSPANTSRLFTLDVAQIAKAGEAMEAPIYYNVGSTSYYVNPSGTSRLYSIMDTPGGISTNAYITAPIYYDATNSAYSVSPANFSRLFDLEVLNTLNVSQGITGSLFGTASWSSNATTASYVLNAISSSFATTGSYVLNAQTASYVLQAVSSSFATTASYAANGGVTQIVAGSNVTISPTNGVGSVTINSTGGVGTGGTDLGLVQAISVGLQNIF